MSRPLKDALLEKALTDLRSTTGLVRRHAASELAALRDPRALNPLMVVAANDPEPNVRIEATRAVAEIRAKDALPGSRRDKTPDLEETSESWSQGIMRSGLAGGRGPATSAEEEEGPEYREAPKATAKTRKLTKANWAAPDRPDMPAAELKLRSTAAENARALHEVRQRSPEEAARLRQQLLDEALRGTGVHVEAKRYGFKLEVHLLDGRRQYVRIGFEQSDFESDKLIVIFSPCGRAMPEHYKWALELNHRLSYGKLGVHKGPRYDEFVMSATLLEATTDPAELRKAILAVAEKADKIEKMFSPEDRY
jgi:hypothetical protein